MQHLGEQKTYILHCIKYRWKFHLSLIAGLRQKKNFLQSIAGTRKGESLWSFGVFVAIKLMSLFLPSLVSNRYCIWSSFIYIIICMRICTHFIYWPIARGYIHTHVYMTNFTFKSKVDCSDIMSGVHLES